MHYFITEASSKEENEANTNVSTTHDVTETCETEVTKADDTTNDDVKPEADETMVKEESSASTKLERHSFKRRTIRKMIGKRKGSDSSRASKEITQDEWDMESVDKESTVRKRTLEKQPSIHDDDGDQDKDTDTIQDNQNDDILDQKPSFEKAS